MATTTAAALTSTDEKLVRSAEAGDLESIASTLVAASGPGLEAALNAAISHQQAAAVLMLLERGALAAAIGVFASALHRPGLTCEQRLAVMEMLLSHHRDLALGIRSAPELASSSGSSASLRAGSKKGRGSSAQGRWEHIYRHAVAKVLNAGAVLREGPLLLAALVRARAAAPDVPRPAAAPAAAAAGGGGEALIAPTDGVEKLVGQRVEAVWEDEDGSTDWFPATIVAHWPTTSEHDRLLMHFDDGMDEIITLPDDTVRLTGEAVVARCKCARCAVRPEAEDGGCTLPLPQPARPRRRS